MISEGANRAIWISRDRSPQAEEALARKLGITPLVAAVLIARGYVTPEEAAGFLDPSLEGMHDPSLLPDCAAAVREILRAKETGARIYVHGDYDVDGVSSAAIWTRSLQRLGFDVVPHVPHRMKEGYGIHQMAVEEARELGCKLFLTCDCGSSAHDMVEMARAFGMRVIVTDHHEISGNLPRAEAIVNPHRKDSNYPYKYLAGAGVAFKVAQRVAEECGAKKEQFQRAYLDLAALGTIADVVPLTGENRIIASFGLRQLAETKKPGVRALIRKSLKRADRALTARDVAWGLGPRLNAAGRIDDAELSLRLLLTDDDSEAQEIADILDQHNRARKTEQERILEHAVEIIHERQLHTAPLIVVAAPGWHTGVIGIVAGKIVERFYRPAFVAAIGEDGIAKGSARSINGFNLHDALIEHSELFLSGGGHERAAGFSVDANRIEEVSEHLVQYAQRKLRPEDLVPKIESDISVTSNEIDFRSVEMLRKFEPFGEGNPHVRFHVRNAQFAFVTPTSKPEHVRFGLAGTPTLTGVGFSFGERLSRFAEGDIIDLLVEPTIDEFNGNRRIDLRLVDLRSNRDSFDT